MTRITFQDRLTAAGNRPSGFDYMRLALATLVLVSHTINVCYGLPFTVSVWFGPARPFLAVLLPMFFALSGFLVAGSLERCRTVVAFAGLRVLRIFPALCAETLLSAVLLGVLFTNLPLATYFTSAELYAYALNMVGSIHYNLPGVFADNVLPRTVNSQLWTLPSELDCYAAITVLVFVGVAQRPKAFIPVLFGFNIALVAWAFRTGIHPMTTVSGHTLVQCFLFGVAGYLYRDKLPWNAWLGFASGVLTFLCLAVPGGDFFAPMPAAYFTVYLGLMQPKRVAVLFGGDYSYGIFLYGFPIQQAVAAALGPQPWYLHLPIALALTVAFSVFSWRVIERPALGMRSALLKVEDAILRKTARFPAGKYLLPPIGLSMKA